MDSQISREETVTVKAIWIAGLTTLTLIYTVNLTIAEGDDVVFMKSERYGVENNPAKDLMNQLLEDV